MAKVQHYRGLHTDLNRLYEAIKKEIESQPNLQIVSEFKGTINDLPLRSIVAVNKSLKLIAGSSEIHISITAILTISQLKLAHMDGFLVCFFQVQLD